MPPEWSPQAAVWLSWPVDDARHWGGTKHDTMWAKFAEIAAAISQHEPVRINAPGAQHPAISAACNRAMAIPEHVQLFDHPHNDVWCRDHGPIFVKHTTTGDVAVTNWGFNAWGGKFPPWNLDDAIPSSIANALGQQVFNGGMILEGGAIEINGAGQLLTTEAVLLNPNRNPELGRAAIEQFLRDGLGVTDILWLQQGIAGDDTDGHIDDLARFADIAGPRAAHLAAIVPYYADFYRQRSGIDGIYVHDSTTISYLLAPHLFTWRELPIRVDTGSSVCRGRTLPALRDSDDEGPWQGRRAVRILVDVDVRGVIELEFEHLSR